MHQDRENLDIIFRRTTPEMILSSIENYRKFQHNCKYKIGITDYSEKAYQHFGAFSMMEYSPDEIAIRYQALKAQISKGAGSGIFYLLYQYADQILISDGVNMECQLAQIHSWNSITHRLGQDIFTTAWLAWCDTRKDGGGARKRSFAWPTILKTDDKRLKFILQKGVAENHFHLHGSTQSFALSWACLMNHPDKIRGYVTSNKDFEENLSINSSRGQMDNVMDWSTRLFYAAWIRALLFERCTGMCDDREVEEKFWKVHGLLMASDIKKETELLRNSGAEYFEQVQKGKKYFEATGNRKQLVWSNGRKCLDYANNRKLYQIDERTVTRLPEGERGLLYRCFCYQFEGKFTKLESMLLYLYLVIKSNFRSELIQTNQRTGFQNFADYQDRKNQFFGDFDEYWTEAQRLSVGVCFSENKMLSLEARIMPKRTAEEMDREIQDLNNRIDKVRNNAEWNYYYVIHFAKKKYGERGIGDSFSAPIPRNDDVRKRAKWGAIALNKYLRLYDMEGSNVCGIDACSSEIGCRPETFATEFRYLYGCSNKTLPGKWYRTDYPHHAKLGLTYHAGEDFLDIADGLRAIDEAISFLELKKGDRIGHGTVLGIGVEKYYEKKRWNIYLTKQDYLDNIVWILYRSLEWNIELTSNLRESMRQEACRYIVEIYGGILKNREFSGYDLLDDYYESWKLRGDHPDLYRSGEYQKWKGLSAEEYDLYREREGLSLSRENALAARLYAAYHFDYTVKKNGLEAVEKGINSEYMKLMKEFQKAVCMEIAQKGIAIECNPTSNVLISNFAYYDAHPIFVLNNHVLKEDICTPNLTVSINTDDIGVFDTSLANEYALLLSAVLRMRHREGNYNDDAVYEYLDYIREFGIQMAFQEKQV